MRLGGRLQAAIEIVEEFERSARPVGDILGDWGKAHRFAGSGDRAAIGNLVHDALRQRRKATAALGADTPRAAVLGAYLLCHAATPDALAAGLEGDRFRPEPLSPAEEAAFHAFDAAALPDAVRADIPDWCAGQLAAAFAGEWTREAEALALRPPLDLRVNRLKSSRDAVIEALADHGAAPTQLSPDGVRIAPVQGHGRHPNLASHPAFLAGWFEVQDEGSQLAALLAAAGAPGQVLDYCAGAGGKTLALSAIAANRGQILAHDVDRRRLNPIRERLSRAGCRNVQLAATPAALEGLEGRMDLVLVDAPCTGSGTWRRRPDSKWRLTEEQLAARIAEQDAALSQAARYVRPGGHLAYVTCSLFPVENEARIAFFAGRHPEFVPLDPRRLLEDASVPAERTHLRAGGIALTPLRSGTDGFFIAMLMRQAG